MENEKLISTLEDIKKSIDELKSTIQTNHNSTLSHITTLNQYSSHERRSLQVVINTFNENIQNLQKSLNEKTK